MSHEIFTIERQHEINEKDRQQVAPLKEKLALAKSLGLEAQERALKTALTTIERGGLIKTAPLTEDELIIWRAWLPTVYSASSSDMRFSLKNYSFDRIPKPVLKAWDKFKSDNLFDSFEIWSPEDNRPDPMLVGVNGASYHLLARWGESDANLISFEDIKRDLVRRWYKGDYLNDLDWDRQDTGLSTLGAVLYSFTFLVICVVLVSVAVDGIFDIRMSAAGNYSLAVSAILTTIFAYVVLYRRRWKELARESRLLNAIARDDAAMRETEIA